MGVRGPGGGRGVVLQEAGGQDRGARHVLHVVGLEGGGGGVVGGVMEDGGRVGSGGADNHLMLVDGRNFNITGKEIERRLDECFITVNKNAIPHDPEKPFVTSGIRVGTPAATTRGLKEEDMKEIARIMGMVARDFEGNKTAAQEAVVALTKKYPIYE